jgi:ubiquinone biosynthesis protein
MLTNARQALRMGRILWHFQIDQVLRSLDSGHRLPYLHSLRFVRWRKAPASQGRAIRQALEALGPIFIKFGQALSTRGDMIPPEIALELAHLQDNCQPFDTALARALIEKELGRPIDALCARFDDTPLASASIAQVHSARLHTGQEVVFKIVRPGIETRIAQDLALMKALAKRLHKKLPRLRLLEVVEEFEKTLYDELDMLRETANASALRANFDESPLLYVPQVHWAYCSEKIMVMERVFGTRISDIARLKEKNISLERLSEMGVEIFFTQVFRDNFFHADMHPGNILVGDDGRYLGLDFGIMGSLSDHDQTYLAENFLAFFNRDYRRVAQLHIDSGWIKSETRVEEFEAAIRTISEPFFGRPLKDISFGLFLLRLFQVARRFEMEIQPQLVLLQKTLLNVEGLGRQLNPELDLWKTAKPFLENWLRERSSPQRLLKGFKTHLPAWIALMPSLPSEWQQLKKDHHTLMLQLANLTAREPAHAHRRQKTRALAGGIVALILGTLLGAGLMQVFS